MNHLDISRSITGYFCMTTNFTGNFWSTITLVYLILNGQKAMFFFISSALSDSCFLEWGIPQGSCLGPSLYIIYPSKLFNITEQHLPDSHCYMDDSQVYLSFWPDELSSRQEAITAMQNCIRDICSWMDHRNPTTVLVLGE